MPDSKSNGLLRCIALSAVARLPRVPPEEIIGSTEDALYSGNEPGTEDTWQCAKPTASREQLREHLVRTEQDLLTSFIVDLGLFRPPVETPERQVVNEYDLLAGHANALPVLNADITSIQCGSAVQERVRLRKTAPAGPAKPSLHKLGSSKLMAE